MDSAFAWTLFALVTGVAHSIGNLPQYQAHTLAFVFDDTSERTKIEQMWDSLAMSFPQEIRKRLAERPLFVSDKEFQPLQAAHAMAWNVRNHMHESLKAGKPVPEDAIYSALLKVPCIGEVIDRAQLTRWVSGSKEVYELLQADIGPKDQARADRVRNAVLDKLQKAKQQDEHRP